MQNRVEEIESFIAHNDHSLAVRRMLDVCLDSGDNTILAEAISWSKTYHEAQKAAVATVSTTFLEQAAGILQRLKKLPATVTEKPLLMQAAGVSKTYNTGHFSLKPIDLQIYASDIVGVVGENGNGKTTLLRCLAGQLALDAGSISFKQLDKPDDFDVKHHVAFIPQRIPRWYGLLKDNLHFSAALAGVHGAQNALMVDFMLERLDLTHYAHLTWNQISSGYRTRFEIARILLQKPSLLILDEPLANLDINAQQTILTDLRYMAKNAHNPMGVILSSQQLHEVEKVADTVLVIKKGSCLFRTGDTNNATATTALSHVVEIETKTDRQDLVAILGDAAQVQYNGGFYTITSTSLTATALLLKLLEHQIVVSYYRDITHSTKRYFN